MAVEYYAGNESIATDRNYSTGACTGREFSLDRNVLAAASTRLTAFLIKSYTTATKSALRASHDWSLVSSKQHAIHSQNDSRARTCSHDSHLVLDRRDKILKRLISVVD